MDENIWMKNHFQHIFSSELNALIHTQSFIIIIILSSSSSSPSSSSSSLKIFPLESFYILFSTFTDFWMILFAFILFIKVMLKMIKLVWLNKIKIFFSFSPIEKTLLSSSFSSFSKIYFNRHCKQFFPLLYNKNWTREAKTKTKAKTCSS